MTWPSSSEINESRRHGCVDRRGRGGILNKLTHTTHHTYYTHTSCNTHYTAHMVYSHASNMTLFYFHIAHYQYFTHRTHARTSHILLRKRHTRTHHTIHILHSTSHNLLKHIHTSHYAHVLCSHPSFILAPGRYFCTSS